ncbi:hypothetical protein OCU04_003188 [Sclerotinia nivalis]|uniref:Uncharacterized protein n=1 Tax=Sclerotinia nivalis TaxID=352851 RepID=A0A9X0AYK5_9HELO|nr:hypothetical protein OCU04_003188 [Sclerotinia nivalis]
MNRNGGRQEASRVRGAEVAFAPTWSHDCSMTPEDDRPVPHLLVPYLDALSSTEEHNGMYSAGFYNNQQVANNWDLQSIASMDTCRDSALGSSLPSAKSTSSVQGLPQAAKEETLIIINSDSQLQVLLEGIALKIDKTRFIRNVRRLIVHFTQDLEQSAIDPREKDVTNIPKLHASWFASRLFDLSSPNKDSELRAMASHLDQNVDKRLLLERYLRNLSGSSADTDAVCEEENVDSNAIDVDDAAVGIDYSNFPNLERIKRFMTRGTAFETLRRNTSQFAGNEQPLPEHMSGQWKQKRSSVSASQKFRFALAKQAKLVMTIQKFLKLIKAHSSLRSYPSTDQAMLDVSEPLPQSPEAKSLNENSDTSLDTYMTTLTDVESSTDDTDYESDDLPDDPELLAFTEERIINPKAYFHKLESLERHVFSNSGLFIHETGISSGPSQDEALLCLPAPRYHKDQTDFLISIIQYSNSKPLLELLVCHNRAHRAGNNLISLQENGYCTRHFSILLQDQYRAGVVRVVQIEIQIVLDLAKAFRRSMNALMANFNSRSHHHMLTMVEIDGLILEYDKQFALTRMCQETLDNIFAPHDVASRPLQTFVWQLTTEIIELAILSYAGAHIQPFDVDLMGKDIPSFRIPQRFQYHDTTLNRLGDLPHISDTSRRGVEIRRRQLQCMDGFLGKKQPWVFHNFNNDSPVDNTRLCLSSTIEALTDLWGPSWKIVRNSSPCEINQYDIGNGAIIPWTVQDGGRDNWPDYVSSEVFCHWIPFKDWNEDEVEANQASLPRRYLLSSDILLIGARNDYGLLVNDKCVPSPASILRTKSRLSDQQALRSPNTSRPRRYVDSHAIQIQGSAMGFISGASQVTYKRRSRHTMKDALVERWRHGLRNPIDLEAYFGIEISLCSRNARRRRLLNILASDTMVNYLHAISFVWGAGVCERTYLKALRCPKSFRKFWKAHKEWQPNIGDAISKCLDALEETGIDEDNQELSAFWVESFDAVGDSDGEDDDDFLGQPDATKDDDSDHGNQSAVQVTTATGIPTPPKSLISLDSDSCKFFEEWIVTLFRSEHTWTGFLEDSEKSLTMAVVGMNCLDFHDRDGFGRCCSLLSKPKGYPVLQTSLQINESLLSGYLGKLKQEKVDGGRKIIWNARELKRGTTFCLGNHGRLEVISGPSKLCPVVVEWMGVKGGKIVGGLMKEMKNVGVNENLFGKGVEKHHKEFIRGCWEVKPLPVLILSKTPVYPSMSETNAEYARSLGIG